MKLCIVLKAAILQKFISCLLIIPLVAAVIWSWPVPVAGGAATTELPAVRYDPVTQTITIGEDYPDQQYAAFPAHPDAPKQTITLPEVQAALSGLVADANVLLENQDAGAWLLKTDLVIRQNARLELTDASLAWLRLASASSPNITTVTAEGGHLLVEGIMVTSWDPQQGDVDREYRDGRSYLLAYRGGRMDIIDAEVAYLGWAAGEPSGLSWRKRGDKDRPETGATGSILRSNIHHNYFGMYTYEAYGIDMLHSKVFDNIVYGIEPHDYSSNFEVAYNQVYNNGRHGIIFSRHCQDNWVHHNEVFNNAAHGIMFDRDSTGVIADNEVYNNVDGIAIFQSSNSTIRDNLLRDNRRGIRINATYDDDDSYDGISTANVVTGNTIQNNAEYGVYLYERADNNIITNNTIAGNLKSGVQIRTGGNTIRDNVIRSNGHGIRIWGHTAYALPDPLPAGAPTPVTAVGQPGTDNRIVLNLIEGNDNTGIDIVQGRKNEIGQDAHTGNVISTNGTYGVALSAAAVDNTVVSNTIHGNGRDGVLVAGADSIGNALRRNSITANVNQGIRLREQANGNIASPQITSDATSDLLTGTAPAGATVEIYSDVEGQGEVYEGRTTANADGVWSFPRPRGSGLQQAGAITLLSIDAQGNTSAFSQVSPTSRTRSTGSIRYQIGTETFKDEEVTTIYVKNVVTDVVTVTLTDLWNELRAITETELLEYQDDKVWQLNANLLIRSNVRFVISDDEATWLRLRSQASSGDLDPDEAQVDYQSFVSLRTYSGEMVIDGVNITSWDPIQGAYDTDIANGRSYVLAKYAARLDVANAELSYLGSANTGESSGVTWRDTDDEENPGTLRTRVTGSARNSIFSHNYFGVYTYLARDMVFQGNQFHDNASYGFDPHDFSTNFLVENNEAFNNGNHGFIISRGCNNFVFRNNRSYNNRYSVDDRDRLAHGFMLDPGAPSSEYPAAPSFDNLLENNEAFGNDGYGLRMLQSNNNIVRGNTFTGNLQGMTVEAGSTGNVIEGNTLSENTIHGLYIFNAAENTTVMSNTLERNGRHGIYIKTGNNEVRGNVVTENGQTDPTGSGIAFLREDESTALADWQLPAAATNLAASNPTIIGELAQSSGVRNNWIVNNTITGNANDGIEMKSAISTTVEANLVESNRNDGIYLAEGAQQNLLSQNIITGNQEYGLKTNGEDVFSNTWTENLIYDNKLGGIVATSDSQMNIPPPEFVQQGTTIVGTTIPGAMLEVFSDTGTQSRYFEGRTTADADGSFTFAAAQGWQAPNITVTVTDANGNTSALAETEAAAPSPDLNERVYLPLTVGSS